MSATEGRAKPTGKEAELNLTGMFTPMMFNNSPVLVQLPSDGDDLFVVVFSSVEQLRVSMTGIPYDKISQITDARQFIGDTPLVWEGQRLRITVDMRAINGKTRFYEIHRH